MKFGNAFIQFSIGRPKTIIAVIAMLTLILGAMIVKVRVDTDPENMLSEQEAVRVFHHDAKKMFGLHDVVVVGVVNESNPNGVFNPGTLGLIHELTEFAKYLVHDMHPEKRVVTQDVVAPGTVDAIEQAGLGEVRFEWLMAKPPTTQAEALKIRDNAMSNPLLKGTLASEDGKALAIYLPITAKDFAFQVRKKVLDKISTFDGDDKFYITGLPVAEDTFGVEMFIQMAISAPMAMLIIFLLMLLFFKKINLIISPMIVAITTVICTMGLLIGTGHTVHIMSSMIPIFLMPIAVVDSIHILSEFFDTYPKNQDRRKTLEQVMAHLFMPMLYTSLTSSAGFASLALTPIPPVRVFGIFVAFGIMLAWLLTIVFIPAYIMLLKETSLKTFGATREKNNGEKNSGLLSRHLSWLGGITYSWSKVIIILTVLSLVGAGYGISRIEINDNPVKWFQKDHDIRIADRVLNQHFGGTYEAYLVLSGNLPPLDTSAAADEARAAISTAIASDYPEVYQDASSILFALAKEKPSPEMFFKRLSDRFDEQMDAAPDEQYDGWADATDALAGVQKRDQVFKRPDVLRYVGKLQEYLVDKGAAGKSNSVTDVVKKVYMELYEAKPDYFRVPDTVNGVAQTLISFQNSHKPDDLWHLVTPDYKHANVWVQLKNGDNQYMESTVAAVDAFLKSNPPPVPMTHQWAGLTYINVVWQNKMVMGMLKSFLGSFLIVYAMMTILFRSPLWGLLAMVPLTVTIALIYGIIGVIGKDYDMPVAVLSSLTLGLAIDFAIHFLERSRSTYQRIGNWKDVAKEMFEEPARAITRNVIVIAVGFTPLLLAPLVPYQTVGLFLASIMAVSGLGTMFILPSLIRMLEGWLFRKNRKMAAQALDVV